VGFLSLPAYGEVPAFSGRRALELLRSQVAFGPRVPGTAAHAKAAHWLEARLREAGGRVLVQRWRIPWEGPDSLELVNIVARFGPDRSGGWLFAAHWDSRPWADRDPDPANRSRPVPGANDGASGTAVLLALADALGSHPPPLPVTLCFFDGEDLGREGQLEDYLQGSKHFAAALPVPPPEAAVVVDMVCRPGQLFDREAWSEEGGADVYRMIAAAEEALGLRVLSGRSMEAVLDDHAPLLAAGIPTALLLGLDDPAWHTVGDRPENCAAESLERVGRLLVELVYGRYLR
jgi:hypothetical protein